jgi:hypothetical protein
MADGTPGTPARAETETAERQRPRPGGDLIKKTGVTRATHHTRHKAQAMPSHTNSNSNTPTRTRTHTHVSAPQRAESRELWLHLSATEYAEQSKNLPAPGGLLVHKY